MNNAVQLITIKEKVPLFKGDEKAERIELILLEENGFELVSQKNLYQVGDRAIYIQPDYCLSNIPLFQSFIEGSYLGKNNRIRAKKFNFHRGDGISIYSNGILLPLKEVFDFLKIPKIGEIYSLDTSINLDEKLGITKYEEPEDNSGHGIKNGSSTAFPKGITKTNEENFNNVYKNLEKLLPLKLNGKMKIDGSSITLWYKDGKYGIASRNLGKPLFIKKVIGRRKKTFLEILQFWKKFDLNIYEEKENDCDFIKYGKPYLDKLINYCKNNNVNLILQGELCGQRIKGSGNKHNPHSKIPTGIIFFNVCEYENQSIKLSETEFNKICNEIIFTPAPLYFNRIFYTIEEIKQECENIFKNELIEGIVIRDNTHNFSCKYMNNEYDSKK